MATQPQVPAQPSGDDDMASTILDVFGLEDTSSSDDGDGSPPVQPSVGTEGEGAGQEPKDGGTPPSPPQAPAPAPSTPPSGEEGTPPSPGSAAPAQQEQTIPAQPGQEQPQQPTSDPRDLEMASLRAQLQSLQAFIAEQQGTQPGGQAPAAGQPGQPGQPPQPQLEHIPVQLPAPLAEAILGEDPQQAVAGINTLLTTVASGLATRFSAQLRQLESKVNERFDGQQQAVTEQEAAAQAEQLREDYFKTFPTHKPAVFLPIIQEQARLLTAEFPGVAWDENFRNTLGVRVNQALAEAGVQVSTVATPPRAPQAPSQPAPMLPSGSRPAPLEEDIITETFQYDFS